MSHHDQADWMITGHWVDLMLTGVAAAEQLAVQRKSGQRLTVFQHGGQRQTGWLVSVTEAAAAAETVRQLMPDVREKADWKLSTHCPDLHCSA